MPIRQLCANLLIPNCLRSNLSYSPLAALEFYVKNPKKMIGFFILIRVDLLEGTLFYVNLPIVVNNLCFEIILDLHLKYP